MSDSPRDLGYADGLANRDSRAWALYPDDKRARHDYRHGYLAGWRKRMTN